MNHDVAGVAAVAEDGDGSISFAPTFHIGADPRHHPRHLEARAEGTRRQRAVEPGPHQQIGEVDAGGLDPEVHLLRPGVTQRHFALDQHLGRAVALDQDRARVQRRH